MQNNCIECNCYIGFDVYTYSISNFNYPFCRTCQKWFQKATYHSTPEALNLYFELRKRNVPAELEKWDGFKTIDIAIVEAKINIEIDGMQHSFNPQQARADLMRTYYSFMKGYYTIRIPNQLVRFHLEETANMITDILSEGARKNKY